jgi:sortase (surface protein transpeptidase)
VTHAVPRRPHSRIAILLSAAVIAAAVVAGSVLWMHGSRHRATAAPVAARRAVVGPTHPVTNPPTAVVPPTAAQPDRSSKPVGVSVPSIGVTSSLQPLRLLANGSLQSPSQWQQAGWFSQGTIPGSVGPAVIAGHVDSVSGPAVFYRLRQVRIGDSVLVRRQNGSVLHFVVYDVRSYPKNQFPTAAVYGPTAIPELRLITCTGDFDYRARSYLDNLVVSAQLSGTDLGD